MDRSHDKSTAGTAALAICESILIALNDGGVISRRQERELLEDAAESHRSAAARHPEDADMHRRTAAEIQRVIDGRKSAWISGPTPCAGAIPGDSK